MHTAGQRVFIVRMYGLWDSSNVYQDASGFSSAVKEHYPEDGVTAGEYRYLTDPAWTDNVTQDKFSGNWLHLRRHYAVYCSRSACHVGRVERSPRTQRIHPRRVAAVQEILPPDCKKM
jgi:hypothetical protein